ncbi:DUF2442 domain-containing protein [Oscillospiraceae bacterium HV4-5-C5C]|nr:DUF2442 domain-containing protein [Oscillospiraceae bacterium HV4-5-C5C]
MRYIKAVVPLTGTRLFVALESGSLLIVDLSVRLTFLRFQELADPKLFASVRTDGDYVIWGKGKLRVTARELMETALISEA